MKELLIYIIQQLVSNSDAVKVEEKRDGSEVNLLLVVDPLDMGIVIGKGGQTIKAIRRILSIRAMTEDVRVNLQVQEPEGNVATKLEDKPSPETDQLKENESVPEEIDSAS